MATTADISEHLEQAYKHLEEALRISVDAVSRNPQSKMSVGELWESFLGRFFRDIRMKSKESKINLLSFVSFAKLWR